MKKNKKLLALICCMALLVGTVGATLAWLTDEAGPVTNTFTVGDINIELTETPNTDSNDDNEADIWKGKLIPGTNLSKDPKVTVLAESEKCYLFVKIEEVNWPAITEEDSNNRKVKYGIADGWTALEGEGNTGVYYRVVEMSDANQGFDVIKDNTIYVSSTLTKAEMEDITDPFTLTFTAYAVQFENITSATAAWDEVK